MGKIDYCSIVLGVDKSILSLALPYGFKFELLSLNELFINDKVRCKDGTLQATYMGHNLEGDEKAPKFLCLVFSEESDFEIKENKREKTFQKIQIIFNILKLFCVENIGLYSIFSRYDGEDYVEIVDNIFCPYDSNDIKNTCIIDSVVLNHATYNLTNSQKEQITALFAKELFEFAYLQLEDILTSFAQVTKYIDNYLLLVQYTSIGEILFLKENDSKREPLSKRIAEFITKDDVDCKRKYFRMLELYKIRSEVVHDGKTDSVRSNDSKDIKKYIQEAILKYFDIIMGRKLLSNHTTFMNTKKNLIIELKTKITKRAPDFYKT